MKMKLKKDKRAWLRLLEVFIAIVLIFSVAIVVYTRTAKKTDAGVEIRRIERVVLQEIARNDELRTAALEEDEDKIKEYALSRMHSTLDCDVRICPLDEICSIYVEDVKDKDIYVDETVISANLTLYEPRKVRLFVWKK